jgi:hypothetical protein
MEKQKALEILYVEINRQLHVTRYRFSIAERRNKFRFAHIFECSVTESEKWRLLAHELEILQIASCIYF